MLSDADKKPTQSLGVFVPAFLDIVETGHGQVSRIWSENWSLSISLSVSALFTALYAFRNPFQMVPLRFVYHTVALAVAFDAAGNVVHGAAVLTYGRVNIIELKTRSNEMLAWVSIRIQ